MEFFPRISLIFLIQVRDAFTNCQDSFAVHPKLIKRLKAYYEKNDPDRHARVETLNYEYVQFVQLYISLAGSLRASCTT